MNYIYDILVDFNYPLYDLFDWNRNDKIYNIKRIPFFYISSFDLKVLKNNRIILDNLMDNIYKKTSTFTREVIDYACVFCDENEAIAFKFNKSGVCIGKSRLLFDEENEIINSINTINVTNLNYKVIKKDKNNNFRTRHEEKMFNLIKKTIFNINNQEKIEYIYYDCFKEMEYQNVKEKLLKRLDVEWDNIGFKLYNFLYVISMNK